jgi:hypothetical protein
MPGYFEKRRTPEGQAWGRPFLVRFLAAQKMNASAAACEVKLIYDCGSYGQTIG